MECLCDVVDFANFRKAPLQKEPITGLKRGSSARKNKKELPAPILREFLPAIPILCPLTSELCPDGVFVLQNIHITYQSCLVLDSSRSSVQLGQLRARPPDTKDCRVLCQPLEEVHCLNPDRVVGFSREHCLLWSTIEFSAFGQSLHADGAQRLANGRGWSIRPRGPWQTSEHFPSLPWRSRGRRSCSAESTERRGLPQRGISFFVHFSWIIPIDLSSRDQLPGFIKHYIERNEEAIAGANTGRMADEPWWLIPRASS